MTEDVELTDCLIAQLSDLHIRPQGELYQGVADSSTHLLEAIEHIESLDRQPDLVLVSGDTVDEGDEREYEQLSLLLERFKLPLFAIPGNHDDREQFRRVFGHRDYIPQTGPIDYCVDNFPVRIVALDSTVPGKHHGAIDPSQIEWLNDTLGKRRGKPTIVMLHHPPFFSGIPYMDVYRCHGDNALAGSIAKSGNVELIVCGHLHRVMMQRWQNTMICSCPSTTTEIALQLQTEAKPASNCGPRGYLLHHWTPAQGLMTHVVNLGQSQGPYAFA